MHAIKSQGHKISIIALAICALFAVPSLSSAEIIYQQPVYGLQWYFDLDHAVYSEDLWILLPYQQAGDLEEFTMSISTSTGAYLASSLYTCTATTTPYACFSSIDATIWSTNNVNASGEYVYFDVEPAVTFNVNKQYLLKVTGMTSAEIRGTMSSNEIQVLCGTGGGMTSSSTCTWQAPFLILSDTDGEYQGENSPYYEAQLNAPHCSLFEFGDCLSLVFTWAFSPRESVRNQLTGLSALLASTTPFAYFYEASDMIDTIYSATGTAFVIDMDFTAFQDTFQTISSSSPSFSTTSVRIFDVCWAKTKSAGYYDSSVLPLIKWSLWIGFLWSMYLIALRIF